MKPILVFLAAAVIAAGALATWRLPSALGYLALGALLGPHALGWLPDNEITRLLAELGVIFLLFVVGLEFSLPTLLSARRTVFGLGGLQVTLVAAVGTIIGFWFGLSTGAALLIGVALAMSSTAIVLKQLRDRGELSSRHGRVSVGILIFQDLATLPLLAVLPGLGGSFDPWAILKALAAALAAFIGLAWLGRRIIRPAFRWIAARRSTELFTLSALLTVMGAASVAHALGLSAPLGAFLAGLVLGETAYRHQIESDLRPFQAVLLGLFFASIGMLLQPQTLMENWAIILSVTGLLVILKAVCVAALARVANYETGVALRTGLILGHGGEFGLLLISVAHAQGLIPTDAGQIVLASVISSMFLAPLLIHTSGTVTGAVSKHYRSRDQQQAEQIAAATEAARDHVIICGFGRTGQNVAELLKRQDHPYVALDLDPERVNAAQAAGVPVVYGDATRSAILEAAGLERARALTITFDEPRTAERVISQARATRADMPILVRTHDDTHFDALIAAGATDVLPEGLEASLMLGAQLLAVLGTADDAVGRTLGAIRAEQYRSLRRFFHASDPISDNRGAYSDERRSLLSVDRQTSVGDLVATIPDVEVTAIIRAGVRIDAPSSSANVRPGDVLELCGRPDVLDEASDRLSNRPTPHAMATRSAPGT